MVRSLIAVSLPAPAQWPNGKSICQKNVTFLPDPQRHRLEDHLVVEQAAGEQAGLADVGELLGRAEQRGDVHLDGVRLVGDELEADRRQRGLERLGRDAGGVGRRRQGGELGGGGFGREADADAVDRLAGAVAAEELGDQRRSAAQHDVGGPPHDQGGAGLLDPEEEPAARPP